MTETIRDVYGVNLSSESINHLDKIANHFKEVVIVHEKTGLDNANVCASMGNDRMTPTITIEKGVSASIIDITHEIWHLYLKVQLDAVGFNINPEETLGKFIVKKAGSKHNAGQLFSELYNILEHHYFFPKMAISCDPAGYFIDSLGGIQNWDNFLPITDYDRQMHTLFILQLMLIESYENRRTQVYLAISERNTPNEFNKAKMLFEILHSFVEVIDETVVFKELFRFFWDYNDPIILERRNGDIYLQSITLSS